MLWFSIITGTATLISLCLQVSGFMKESRKYFIYSTLFLAGITLGLVLNIAFSLKMSLPLLTSPKQLVGIYLFCGSGLLIFVLFILVALIEDVARRTMIRNAAAAVSGFLIFLLVFFVDTFFK